MKWLIFFVLFVLVAGCLQNGERGDQLSFDQAIIADAKAKYKDADIVEIEGSEIVGGINMTNVRVTFNSTSVCPVRMRLRYRSPTFGYETGVPTYIVKDCKYTCELNCVIVYEEEAIVAAHTLPGSDRVSSFIGDGSNIVARATYDSANEVWNVSFTNKESGDVMLVTVRARNPAITSVAMKTAR